MTIFSYSDDEALGSVLSVDTATVVVKVADVDRLRRMQVNRLVVLQSSKPGQHLIGVVQKITRSALEPSVFEITDVETSDSELPAENNLVRIALIGTLIDRVGDKENVFRRTLETVPEIEAYCFAIEGDRLTAFMRTIAEVSSEGERLSLGRYTLDEDAEAYLNGNKFFQRHAVVVGSTGSGKSWTIARILEQVAVLVNTNAIVFDIHGEYSPLTGDGIEHYRIAGPNDLETGSSLGQGIIFLPYWLLDYDAMISMFVDRSDQNAPNQAMVMARTVTASKRKYLEDGGHQEILDNFTIDSPVPFDLDEVIAELERLDKEMVKGSSGREKQGDFHGRLSRLISRLENKKSDRRLGFLFKGGADSFEFGWLEDLGNALVAGRKDRPSKKGGVKVIDFSEVPSDVLPLIVSLVARLAFSIQQWTVTTKRHPIAFFCDEAHSYIPERSKGDASNEISVHMFERIAKEGRKYGVGLVVISQRPAEVSRTVLSQSNNLIAMRLTNAEDQGVVRRLLPDSLGGFADLLPVLDTGEALVVGDASLLPSRIRVTEPTIKPDSGTIDFWDKWSLDQKIGAITDAVRAWRRQSLQEPGA